MQSFIDLEKKCGKKYVFVPNPRIKEEVENLRPNWVKYELHLH